MPAVPARHLGFLGTSLCLHALVLGAAALWGFAVLEPEPPATFVLTLKPKSAATEALVAMTFEPDVREELVLQEPGAGELFEPELLESELWDEPLEAFPLAEVAPESLVSVDLSPGYPFLEGKVESPGNASGTLAAAGSGTLPNGQGTGAGPLASGGSAGGASGAGSLAGKPGGTALAGTPGPAGVVADPVPLDTPRPSYPRLAVRSGAQGSVLCRLHVGVDGSVLEVEIVESSGHELLDQAARTAVTSWRFEPRRVDGKPVTARVLHRITFRLTEG